VSFDVICAGKPIWKLVGPTRTGVRFRSGLMSTAGMLSRMGLRVGLATVLDDNVFGRKWLRKAKALGLDVGGVSLAAPEASLVVIDAGGGESGVLFGRETEAAPDVPPPWSSQVLLLSGLSPVTSTAAALCRAGRRARRDGAMVVLDLLTSVRLWAGRDPRSVLMVLREADAVRCSLADLAVLQMDPADVRRALRPRATLVVTDADGAIAAGAFGEVKVVLRKRARLGDEAAGDSCTAAICAEWARPAKVSETPDGRWHGVLQRWSAGLPGAAGP
jgi:sugar/nucleoside kinase (ribokinase family)